MLARLWLSAWGANCGARLTVLGWPIIRLAPASTVQIGSDCTFFSADYANPAGMNRPCYVCTIRDRATVRIGDNCGFSSTVISAAVSITIGNNVLCGANCTITDTDWHNVALTRRHDSSLDGNAPVVIENDVWLGMNVTVLKGVRIGAGTVVAAGSVVSRDLPPGVVAGGIPARMIRPMTIDELQSDGVIRSAKDR
jgi:acetyltransferase-like isoleucine patch superfamily enzyme